MADRKHDPDELLAAGWHLSGYSYMKHELNRDKPSVREFRVVLASSVLGKKYFGFGANFESALTSAAEQI